MIRYVGEVGICKVPKVGRKTFGTLLSDDRFAQEADFAKFGVGQLGVRFVTQRCRL